jgi:hypothetical protein
MNASPLNYIDGELIMKDLREDNIKILMISEKHKTSFFLDDIRNSQSLNIYYESGIFNRQRIKFRLRNLFRKVYQIDLGFDYVSVVGKSRYKYNFDSY